MSTVAQAIERIRDLAQTAARIDAELDKRHGIDPKLGMDYFDPKSVARRQETNAAKVEMEKYLNTSDTETLRRVEAVMYSGRSGGAAAVDERDVLRENNPRKEDVVRTIIEKRMNFDVYFDRGLDRAKADGIDVDSF
jgi:hypothetical protein